MRQLYAYVANESTEVPVASQSAMRNSKFISLECAITLFFLLPLTERLELQFPFHCLKSSALTSQFWLKCIFKSFMLITIFKMAALDNNDQNSSWFCSFCSWNQAFVPGIKGEKNSTGGTSINGYHPLKWLSSPTWMLFLHYQEQ